MTSTRLVLDAAACDGHGICALCCPERLGLDRWGYPQVSADPLASPRLLAKARRAVAACPEGALSLEPVPDDGTPRRAAHATPARPVPRRARGWWR